MIAQFVRSSQRQPTISDVFRALLLLPQRSTSALEGSQEFVSVRLEGDPPCWDDDLSALRVPRALKHLVPRFRPAVRASDRLVPAPGPSCPRG